MSKKGKRIDPDQLDLFDNPDAVDSIVDRYISLKMQMLGGGLSQTKKEDQNGDMFHADSEEVADFIKNAIRESGMSRARVCDEINRRYGWLTEEEYKELKREKGLKPKERIPGVKNLSYAMFNHFLSKPMRYQIKAHFLLAIQEITDSLKIVEGMAETRKASVVPQDEAEALMVLQLDDHIKQLQTLKKAFNRRRRG